MSEAALDAALENGRALVDRVVRDLPALIAGMTGFRPNAAYLGPHDLDPVTYVCRGCGEALADLANHQDRPCVKGLWPLVVVVPVRAVRGPHIAPVGVEEGDLCLRSVDGGPPCLGKLEIRAHSSHGGQACCCGPEAPPCRWCLSQVPACPVCDYEGEPA